MQAGRLISCMLTAVSHRRSVNSARQASAKSRRMSRAAPSELCGFRADGAAAYVSTMPSSTASAARIVAGFANRRSLLMVAYSEQA